MLTLSFLVDVDVDVGVSLIVIVSSVFKYLALGLVLSVPVAVPVAVFGTVLVSADDCPTTASSSSCIVLRFKLLFDDEL
jgi:hypothetical protein